MISLGEGSCSEFCSHPKGIAKLLWAQRAHAGKVVGHRLCDFPGPLPFALQGWSDFQKMNGMKAPRNNRLLHVSQVLARRWLSEKKQLETNLQLLIYIQMLLTGTLLEGAVPGSLVLGWGRVLFTVYPWVLLEFFVMC